MFSLGIILGSIFVGKIDSRKYVGKLLFLGVIAVGGLTVALAFTTVAWLALGVAFGVGFFNAIVNIPLSVLIQAKIPGELLGRVATSLGALITLSQPISAATAGGVAGSLSIGWERSEEHTSELQSRLHLVCRLLLEKKKES